MFGFDSEPHVPTPAEKIYNALNHQDTETALNLLEAANSPCERIDLAKQVADLSGVLYRMQLSNHGDGSQTVGILRLNFGTVVSKDQPQCER